MELNTIVCGDSLVELKKLPSESVDCCITSPPYWGLRDYGVEGQLGFEPTFQLYIGHLQEIFDEVYRVLTPTGTCWVNLGDTFNGEKSLCNIPHRFAISMTDNGWIERNCIIWHKPSCMPSSAKDRFTVDFEYVFFFVKNKKYWFEQQFTPMSENTRARDKNGYNHAFRNQMAGSPSDKRYPDGKQIHTPFYNERGRNKRAVWRINPQPFRDAHFAVFPEKLIEPMILAGCPPEICDKCNLAYEPTYDVKKGDVIEEYTGQGLKDYERAKAQNPSDTKRSVLESMRVQKTKTRYAPTCNCNKHTHPGVVLDPFAGSGTTALVARKLSRNYIGIDLNHEYVEMARKRLAKIL